MNFSEKENQKHASKILDSLNEVRVVMESSLEVRNETKNILEHIQNFNQNVLGIAEYTGTPFYVYDNSDFDMLHKIHYSHAYNRIVYSNHHENIGYADVIYAHEVFIIAHETCHHLQKLLNLSEGKILSDNEFSIYSESQADYFAGYFSSYCVSLGLLSMDDISKIKKLVYSLGTIIPDFMNSIIEKSTNPQRFIIVDKDCHGTGKHRQDMFELGYNSGEGEYFLDIDNFIPSSISHLEITKGFKETGDMIEEFKKMIK